MSYCASRGFLGERSEPAPGSHGARMHGCSCPVVDNAFGAGALLYRSPDIWFLDQLCILHGNGIAPTGTNLSRSPQPK